MGIVIPTPETVLTWTWFLMGITFGRAGANLDQIVKTSQWYIGLVGPMKALVDVVLDCLHHWWIGMMLVLYTPYLETQWFGWGLVSSDTIDIPVRVMKTLSYLKPRIVSVGRRIFGP